MGVRQRWLPGMDVEWTWKEQDNNYEDFQKPSEEELRELLTPLQYRVT